MIAADRDAMPELIEVMVWAEAGMASGPGG